MAADSLRVTRRIAAQPALAKFKPQEWKPGTQYQSDEDLARLAGGRLLQAKPEELTRIYGRIAEFTREFLRT